MPHSLHSYKPQLHVWSHTTKHYAKAEESFDNIHPVRESKSNTKSLTARLLSACIQPVKDLFNLFTSSQRDVKINSYIRGSRLTINTKKYILVLMNKKPKGSAIRYEWIAYYLPMQFSIYIYTILHYVKESNQKIR